MRRVWLALALAGLLLVPGCLDSSTYEGLWDNLEAKDRFQEQSMGDSPYNQSFSFASVFDPTNPPSNPDNVADRWNTTITLPNGTRSMTVLFSLNFSASQFPTSPLPVNPPDGDIRIYAQGPDGEEGQNTTLQENADLGFEFTDPKPGEWTIGYEARGEGNITFRVFATVPVNGTGS